MSGTKPRVKWLNVMDLIYGCMTPFFLCYNFNKGEVILNMKEMQEYRDTLALIVDTIKSGKAMEISSVLELCAYCHEIYETMYEQGKDEDKSFSCRHALQHILPIAKVLLTKENVVSDTKYLQEVYALYRKTFAFVSRRSLSHFIEFMEWERTSHRQVFNSRKEILEPIAFYLNKMVFDKSIEFMVVSLPPSSGKTFIMNYFTAWNFGIDLNASMLRLSYGEELVLGFSRAIKELVTSELFAEVFPDYRRFGGKPFEKEKESDWKLKGADVQTSHIARTRDGAITGVRANKFIIFDDMTKGREEATNSGLHESLYSKWNTEWSARTDGNETRFIFAGTMWSPMDILNRIIEEREYLSPLQESTRFKYCMESADGKTIVIRVPMLDENDKSTCESVLSTEKALQKRQFTDEYEWSCVYQQSPIAPSGLVFANENLIKFDYKLVKFPNYSMATLDPARKGKDNVSMPILQVNQENGTDHCLVDVLYQKKAMTDLYDDIVQRVIDNNVIELVIENNTDTSLAFVIESKLKERGYLNCNVREKYATVNKEQRIKDARGVIIKRIRFKSRGEYAKNSDYGRFMSDLEHYSFDFPNKHDDAPDSLAMYVNEIVLDKFKMPKAKGVDRGILNI